jgi:phosphate starvation-inducible PhoH-like protein
MKSKWDKRSKQTVSRNRALKAQQKKMNQAVENTIHFNQPLRSQARRIDLIPRTRNQERLVLALNDPDIDIVVTVGPAGTGKSYLAMLAAIKALRQGDCDRIVLTRPAVEVEGEKLGFLPGTLEKKMEPWTRPLFDVMREYYRSADIMAMINEGIVEISPLAFMRGRTFKNSFIIADEMQNATPAQAKMLMTRIGQNSKIVITGDIEQTDRSTVNNALVDLCQRLRNTPVDRISVCNMELRDIQRHRIIQSVLNLYAT